MRSIRSLKRPFFVKACIKRTQQMQGDAARQVDPTCRENFQRQIARFAGKNRNQHFNSCPA